MTEEEVVEALTSVARIQAGVISELFRLLGQHVAAEAAEDGVEAEPEVRVLLSLEAASFPFVQPAIVEGLYHVGRVAPDMDFGIVPANLLQAQDDGQQFHPVVGGAGEAARQLFLVAAAAEHDAVAARPGIPAGSAVGEQIDSRSRPFHKLCKVSKKSYICGKCFGIMTILVTGAGGMLGTAFRRAAVHCADRWIFSDITAQPGQESLYLDVTDTRALRLVTASEQVDADTLLYHLDPMRLAEPRSQYPCSAPARLRIGPDWVAYVGNWMTEWERFGTEKYRDKILTGMQSIAELPDGIFTGNLAKGYDPATGRLSYDGDPTLRKTNHLLTIMGGFEVMTELLTTFRLPLSPFHQAWADFARRYKQMAFEVQGSKFPVRRLEAYAAWLDRDAARAADTWKALWGVADNDLLLSDKTRRLLPPEVPALLDEVEGVSTNNASLWSLDAIYMQEVLP